MVLKVHTPAAADTTPPDKPPFWLDLLHPTPEEIAKVAAECGLQIPSRESLQEIEASSRLRSDGRVLYLSMPLAIRDDAAGFAPVPLGFILSPDVLITIRYSEVHALDQLKSRLEKDPPVNSAAVFAAIIEAIVDYGADMLEALSSHLAAVSAKVFRPQKGLLPHDKRFTLSLRESLQTVGTAGDDLSHLRECLLGLQRIVGYVAEMATDWLKPDVVTRLKTARQDLASLVDFEAHLTSKTQFLLDAILGFISTEQNDIFKVLTIVSVAGIPPTLIASMYGMNFHFMPELTWRWGYPYALTLIAVSTLLPMIWFKRRGWW